MGQKVLPYIHRLGVVTDWKSKWFGGKNYANYLHQDFKIRDMINARIKDGGISDIHIARTSAKTIITIHTSKPGVIVGRSGANVDELRLAIERKLGRGFQIEIAEIRKPELVAKLVAEQISQSIAERVPYRTAIKQSIRKIMESGAKGVRITVGGRLNGAEIARSEGFSQGRVPLQTIRADIDFAKGRSNTTYGVIGVRVWIYKGEVFEVGGTDNK
jgi:small subunit ribosomal protein S3